MGEARFGEQVDVITGAGRGCDEIRDETDYTVPAGPAEEMSELFKVSTSDQ